MGFLRPKAADAGVSIVIIINAVIGITLLLAQIKARAQGSWQVQVENAGIASMHTAVTRFDTVVMLDRTNVGASQINLTGRCRYSPQELALKHDCTAHSVLFTPGDTSVRPLFVQTDTWCSSGQFFSDGTLVQTGGDFEGLKKIRRFRPCPPDQSCDWVESANETLTSGRWYSTNQLLPNGTSQIIVGGRNAFSYEFIPNPSNSPSVYLPFLHDTKDPQGDNLYPFVHLLPDGNLYIFANRDSIILNYHNNTVVKTFPTIPGEPRNYPSAGSSVMLPLCANDSYCKVEILVCGGSQLGAFFNTSLQLPASPTCGRIDVTATNPAWEMETMPYRRVMGDMVLLPSEDVLIINGAQNGCQGWGMASNPILTPLLYHPTLPYDNRFSIQAPSFIPRLYHSTANLLSNGKVLVAGSNPHQYDTFTGDFPTELRVETFSPQYLDFANDNMRPTILQAPESIAYNETFMIRVAINMEPNDDLRVVLLSAPFTTHSFSQGQRLLGLHVEPPTVGEENVYVVTATTPPMATLAPSAYYMMFVVNEGIPSSLAKWVHVYAPS